MSKNLQISLRQPYVTRREKIYATHNARHSGRKWLSSNSSIIQYELYAKVGGASSKVQFDFSLSRFPWLAITFILKILNIPYTCGYILQFINLVLHSTNLQNLWFAYDIHIIRLYTCSVTKLLIFVFWQKNANEAYLLFL